MNEDKLLAKVMSARGPTQQLRKFQEELSECSAAVAHYIERGFDNPQFAVDLISEMADVDIMLKQARTIMETSHPGIFTVRRRYKIARLTARFESGKLRC